MQYLLLLPTFIKVIVVIIVLLSVFLSTVLCYMGWIKIRRSVLESDLPLAIRWEGFYKDKNFRDIAESINQCYGRKIMRNGLVFRSNGWFSGWDCNKVGNPETIYSLNFDPEKNDVYFCWDSQKHEANIGKVLNPTTKISDLEDLDNWQKEAMRQSACTIFESHLTSIQQKKRVLIHCDAGRDRTGVFASILAAIAAETTNALNRTMLGAIECDYRKTETLAAEKYGRMENFIKKILEKNSISQFLSGQCNIPKSEISRVGDILADTRWRDSIY